MEYYESTNDFCDGQIDQTAVVQSPGELSERDEKILDFAEALNQILQWCFTGGKQRVGRQTVCNRFVSMCAVLRPDLVGNKNYRQIGKMFRIRKSIISRYALDFQDRFGVQFRRSQKRHFQNNHKPKTANGKITNRMESAPTVPRDRH